MDAQTQAELASTPMSPNDFVNDVCDGDDFVCDDPIPHTHYDDPEFTPIAQVVARHDKAVQAEAQVLMDALTEIQEV